MGIGGILANKKDNDTVDQLTKATNKGKSSRNNRRRQKKMTRVQRLYEMCKQVFSSVDPGIVPPPNEIQRLKSILDEMTPDDVGLRPDMSYFLGNNGAGGGLVPKITYLHIYECPKFSIGIFCLPRTSVIPLHNHPQMTVLSKLLFGTMHIKSYDWADTNVLSNVNVGDGVGRLAKLKVDGEFTAPCGTSILYPADGGNMHCFTALSSCAVLDVLGPPYSDPEGRHCTYYLEYPLSTLPAAASSSDVAEALPESSSSSSSPSDIDKRSHAWLKERKDNPEDLTVVGGLYSGPAIKEK
ncbi:plant cysteine oxidase 2 [Impatiens glandulifera]|uniref:plant cysteine oxidase 2 n=1 Tax=Impatiens glandulifera TaxID=253017 RepID=UPI001FB04FA5|nr:plant cysteine oxidase 2 [Impatiens glandulifera]